MELIEKGDLENLRSLFASVPFDQRNPLNSTGCTPLHYAVLRGYLEMSKVKASPQIQFLMEECQADSNTKDYVRKLFRTELGRTALHIAASEGFLSIVLYLLREGRADINARTDVKASTNDRATRLPS